MDEQQLTLTRLWQYLGFQGLDMPLWPPDLFALCAMALKKSGAYTGILHPVDDAELVCDCESRSVHADHLCKLGSFWREVLDAQVDPDAREPDKKWLEIKRRWLVVQNVLNGRDLPVFRIGNNRELLSALLDLLAISDEACRGLGLPLRAGPNGSQSRYGVGEEADNLLFPRQLGSTLCKTISPSALRVLPKMHTAQCGLTVRSFSHHLAICESDEVRPSWISVPGSRGNARDISRMNIVVAPWPERILPSQISEFAPRLGVHSDLFEFEISSPDDNIADRCLSLVERAEKVVGPVDAMVFPELSMTTRDYRIARAALLRKGILIIAGVGSKRRAQNYLAFDVPVSCSHAVHFRQRKHHRWKLDRSQISQYHLGSRLNPQHHYWENIEVQDRKLNFVVLRPWLVATALICEDLARHDPVGDLIKGIGPNLVIALLMDGPQIAARWSSRYASNLADDPGCSVLSVTSVGMAELSRPMGKPASRVIALWKDAPTRTTTEIDLPRDADGVVLTLTMKADREITADCRWDGGFAVYPTLSGFHFLKAPPELHHSPKQAPLGINWLTPKEASFLARMVQREDFNPDIMPPGLDNLRGSAFRIGREIWRIRTSDKGENPKEIRIHAWPCENWASAEEEDSARQIINWNETNRWTTLFPGP